MADNDDETTAALAETVRALQEEVARLRAEQSSHQCACVHYHWAGYPVLPAQPYVPPFTVTCEAPFSFIQNTAAAAPLPQIQSFYVTAGG